MKDSVKDILASSLENLDKSDYEKFRNKLLDEGETKGITKRRIDRAESEYELAGLLNETFVGDQRCKKYWNVVLK